MSPSKANEPAMTKEALRTLLTEAKVNVTAAAKKLEIRRETLHRWLKGTTPISRANAALIRETFKRK